MTVKLRGEHDLPLEGSRSRVDDKLEKLHVNPGGGVAGAVRIFLRIE